MIQIEELKRDLSRLNEQLADLRTDIARNYAPRREIIRQRRRTAWIFLAVLGMLLVGGYVTSRVTLTREHRIVAECFLRPSVLGPAKVKQCARTFPGYAETQSQGQANLKVFLDLQRRVAKLEAQAKAR